MAHSLLVIDDDNDLLDAIKMVLELEGYRITCAHNGREAFQLLDRQIKFDAILLDLTMPVMNGLEFLENFNQKDFGIPIIVVTASGKSMIENPLLKNAAGIIRKPFQVDELIELLNQLPTEDEVSIIPRRVVKSESGTARFQDPRL